MFEVGKIYYGIGVEEGASSIFFKIQSRDLDRLYVLEVVEHSGVKSVKRKIYDVFKDPARCILSGTDDAEYVKYLGVVEIQDNSVAFKKFEEGYSYPCVDLYGGKDSWYRVSKRDQDRAYMNDTWYDIKGTGNLDGEYIEFMEYRGCKICVYARNGVLR